MESKKRDIVGFMTGILTPSMSAGFSGWEFKRLSKKVILKFDNKMKLDGNPFPRNMIGFSVDMVTAEEKEKLKFSLQRG
jgi:hypothetical protein